MDASSALQPMAWIAALLVLVACWPISQALRHPRLRPLAAFLLFTSVLALVSAGIFWALLLIVGALFGAAALEGPVAAVVIVLISLLSGFAAGRAIVRRPQVRRMPK